MAYTQRTGGVVHLGSGEPLGDGRHAAVGLGSSDGARTRNTGHGGFDSHDAVFFGIQFTHGTFMPGLAPERLVDSSFIATPAGRGSVWLDGCRLELPDPENVDAFVERLVGAGLLAHDPIAAAAVRGDVSALSTRSIERRVARATGLTRGAVRQIRRADRAVELLCQGRTPLDVVHLAGYADQSHLTRSLKRLVGRTPSQIAAVATAA